ncbi:MAG TPA: hypothetical protein VJB65_01960, partial [Patescibacteria group bacterium]|nr:hypothetical protein [Patescibacteria group bacterium]
DTYKRPIYRLEKPTHAQHTAIDVTELSKLQFDILLIAGSEGKGIQLPIKGTSVFIQHTIQLESLNISHALAIALFERVTTH